jgi:hypothetical protein
MDVSENEVIPIKEPFNGNWILDKLIIHGRTTGAETSSENFLLHQSHPTWGESSHFKGCFSISSKKN